MSFISLCSTNPQFSFLLRKNPATGMMVKSMRLGRAFGWFSNDQTYHIFFRDAENEISYKSEPDQSFEYVDTTRYSSMMFVINAIGDFFNAAIKKPDENDTIGFENTLFINMVSLRGTKYIDVFNRHFDGFDIQADEVAHKTFRLTVTTKRSIADLLRYVSLFAAFNVLRNEGEYLDINESVVDKYLACLTAINAPYFVRYVFKVNLLRGPTMFNKYKALLNTADIDLEFGNTAIQRRNAIQSRLSMKNNIIDIGCGEGAFVFNIIKTLDPRLIYYALDIRPEARDRVQHKAKLKQLENITVLENFDQFLAFHSAVPTPFRKYDVLMVEVIEHMEIQEAEDLVKSVLAFGPESILITTPNKSFNQFYDFEDDELRHDDHKFEFTEPEFEQWVLRVTGGVQGYTTKIFTVGDRVKGIPTTLGVKIARAQ